MKEDVWRNLTTIIANRNVGCLQPLPNDIKRVERPRRWVLLLQSHKVVIIVSNHGQKQTAQFMRIQLQLRVKAEHKSIKIGAILLQFPLAIHLHKRE